MSLDALARPSGGLAMVAMDQRESLRGMIARHRRGPVGDDTLVRFKLAVAREVAPHASGFLIDRQFGFHTVAEERMLPASCGLILAADSLAYQEDGLVRDTTIDRAVVPGDMRRRGAAALKLLVVWRSDAEADRPRSSCVPVPRPGSCRFWRAWCGRRPVRIATTCWWRWRGNWVGCGHRCMRHRCRARRPPTRTSSNGRAAGSPRCCRFPGSYCPRAYGSRTSRTRSSLPVAPEPRVSSLAGRSGATPSVLSILSHYSVNAPSAGCVTWPIWWTTTPDPGRWSVASRWPTVSTGSSAAHCR